MHSSKLGEISVRSRRDGFALTPAEEKQTTIFLDGNQERKGCINFCNPEYKDPWKAESRKRAEAQWYFCPEKERHEEAAHLAECYL
jgi:hypothetical protein